MLQVLRTPCQNEIPCAVDTAKYPDIMRNSMTPPDGLGVPKSRGCWDHDQVEVAFQRAAAGWGSTNGPRPVALEGKGKEYVLHTKFLVRIILLQED